MRGQCAHLLQKRSLLCIKSDELKRNRQSSLKRKLRAKLLDNGVVEIDAACLQLRTHRVIDATGGAMFNFVS
jgi:hypothetical protein